MNKTRSSAPTSASGNAAPTDMPTFRTNPQVDAKIDSYIKENPKYWAYVQAMPRERLERTVVLNEVREVDRQQRIVRLDFHQPRAGDVEKDFEQLECAAPLRRQDIELEDSGLARPWPADSPQRAKASVAWRNRRRRFSCSTYNQLSNSAVVATLRPATRSSR